MLDTAPGVRYGAPVAVVTRKKLALKQSPLWPMQGQARAVPPNPPLSSNVREHGGRYRTRSAAFHELRTVLPSRVFVCPGSCHLRRHSRLQFHVFRTQRLILVASSFRSSLCLGSQLPVVARCARRAAAALCETCSPRTSALWPDCASHFGRRYVLDRANVWPSRPRVLLGLYRSSGAILLALGLRLALERRQ